MAFTCLRRASRRCEPLAALLFKPAHSSAVLLQAVSTPACRHQVRWINLGTNMPPNVDSYLDRSKGFEATADELLESFCEVFEQLPDKFEVADPFDVQYADGVLTLELDHNLVYVLTRHNVNKQVWLSSPFSGPKRFSINGDRVQSEANVCIFDLISVELTSYFKKSVQIVESFKENNKDSQWVMAHTTDTSDKNS